MSGAIVQFFILGIIFLIVFLILKGNNKKGNKRKNNSNGAFISLSDIPELGKHINDLSPYLMEKKVEEFSVVGMKYRKKMFEMDFLGMVLCDEYNKYDKYAVEVTDYNRYIIGYIPRYENEELYKFLLDYTKGKHFAYGFVENIDGEWRAKAYVPFGYDKEDVIGFIRFRKYNQVLTEYRDYLYNNEYSYLNDTLEIILEQINIQNNFRNKYNEIPQIIDKIYIPKLGIKSIVNFLFENDMFHEVSELQKYDKVFDEFGNQYQKFIRNKISLSINMLKE